MTKTFNAQFYATVAQVIPVLFVALAVQGPTYQAMLTHAGRMARIRREEPWRRRAWAKSVSWFLRLVAWTTVVGGTYGEINALLALRDRTEDPITGRDELLVVGFLILMTAAGPAVRFVQSVTQAHARSPREPSAIPGSAHQARGGAAPGDPS